jgi:hypothetical protein
MPMDAPMNDPTALRPRGVGEILTAAFQLYGRHWQNLITLVAVVVIPLSIVQSFLSDQLIRKGFENDTVTNGVTYTTTSAVGALFAGLFIAVISILIWGMLTSAITLAAVGTFLGRDMDIGASYRFGLARFWSVVLIVLLMALAIIAGLILLVIPGLIVLTRLTCAVPALVVEGKRGRSALSRSWNLVKGRGWPVFGTIIVAGIITSVVSGIFTAPFTSSWVARGLASAIASVITMPFSALVGIVIYLDLRVRKEQLDRATLERELAGSAAA